MKRRAASGRPSISAHRARRGAIARSPSVRVQVRERDARGVVLAELHLDLADRRAQPRVLRLGVPGRDGEAQRLVEAMLREQARLEHLRGSRVVRRPVARRAPRRGLGAQHVARVARLAGAREVERAEVREVRRAGRVALDARREVGDVELADLRVAPRRRGGCGGRDVGRRRPAARREDHSRGDDDVSREQRVQRVRRVPRGLWRRAHGYFAAARYGNVAMNPPCDGTLSVQSGSAHGLQTACVGSSRSLKIAERPVSTTSSVSVRPP